MQLPKFLASLLPNFKKDRVVEDCRLTRAEILESTLPAFEAAVPQLKSWKFKNKDVERLMGTFSRMVKSSGGGNAIVVIHKLMKPTLENLDQVEALIVKTYNDDIAGAGITYLKANLLQFVECVGFVSKFSRKFLNYVYVCETAEFADSNTSIQKSMTPAEIKWLEQNFMSFCTALNAVSGNPQHVKKSIDDIPDVVITTDNASTLAATIGETKIDPFQMKLIPIWMNPIYHIGIFVAEWQAERYKTAKEELKLLQLRQMNLEKIQEKKPDARLQQQIDYNESRIQGLNFKLMKMESAHA